MKVNEDPVTRQGLPLHPLQPEFRVDLDEACDTQPDRIYISFTTFRRIKERYGDVNWKNYCLYLGIDA